MPENGITEDAMTEAGITETIGMENINVKLILHTLDEYGFCVIPGVLEESHAIEMRALIDQYRADEAIPENAGATHTRVLHLAAKNAAFLQLMCHPLTMAVGERYLGSDFICSTWSSNTIHAGSDFTYWHVDHPFWTIAAPYPVDPPLSMHAIWCLDEFTAANGSTMFIPGSHRNTHLPAHNADYGSEGVIIEAPIGSVVFAHGACWHSGGLNATANPRTGIFGRYARSYIIPQEDMRHELQDIKDPTPLQSRLMGAKQYVPRRAIPY